MPNNIADWSGNARYDAARLHWGSLWRTPTLKEIEELKDKCEWKWRDNYKGVSGYEVIGPNGNNIFLPAAGNRYRTSWHSRGEYGYYWCSTPRDNNIKQGNFLFLSNRDCGYGWSFREIGRCIRAVAD